ncbi:hypothetical protein ABHC69_18125, partial [Parabacteroides distasonis]
MKAYLKWIVLITWSFTMTSCIKENLPECIPDNTGIVLKFRYPTGTNTPSNKNGIDRLSVFIFDDKGVFVSQIRWVLSIPFFISCIRQQNPLTVLS